MNNIDGAILFRCGDSRNGGLYKALKMHFDWLPSCRIKTLALAGGGHTDIPTQVVIKQAGIYTKALLNKGATNIALIITEHDDCGFVQLVGQCNLEHRWLGKRFINKLFREVPSVQGIYLMHVGYTSIEMPTVPSDLVRLTEIGKAERVQNNLLKVA